jgi:hypothetical protein
VSDYWEDPWLGGDGQTAYATVSEEKCPECGAAYYTHDAKTWLCDCPAPDNPEEERE